MTAVNISDKVDPGPMIWARDLKRIYTLGASDVVGVSGIDLDIAPGQLVVLKGNSGSGKSTLLSLLAGLDRPSGGSLKVGNVDLTRVPDSQLTRFRRNVVGMVFQNFNLLPTLTALENVCLPALLKGEAFMKVCDKAKAFLDWLELSARLHHFPSQLSGGEMQRTAIARALINDPTIVLADEPTGNLDSRNGQTVMALLAELNRMHQRTVIVATHSDLADRYATTHILLKDGAIVRH